MADWTERGLRLREQLIKKVLQKKVIAIVRGLYGESVLKLAETLFSGGIEMMEVTFDQLRPETHSATVEAIRLLNERIGDRMLIGAGTVTSERMVESAHSAGARYIVSPNVEPNVIRRTAELGLVSMPGALSPTEIIAAHSLGADFVKVFPAAQLGADYIKAVRGPCNHIPLLAVGGVNERNAKDFLAAGCVGVGVGGNLANKDWIAEDAFERILALAREYAEIAG